MVGSEEKQLTGPSRSHFTTLALSLSHTGCCFPSQRPRDGKGEGKRRVFRCSGGWTATKLKYDQVDLGVGVEPTSISDLPEERGLAAKNLGDK
jgi:hypothetical protein